jgi:hypothetical protein
VGPGGNRAPEDAYVGTDTTAKAVPVHAVLAVEHLGGDARLPILRLRQAT